MIRSDENLTIANLIPGPEDYETPVACGWCSRSMKPNHRGDLFTGPDNPTWVCDACGLLAAPDLFALVLRLREPGFLAVTQNTPRIDKDDLAWDCPLCGQTGDEEPSFEWHVVDSKHGRRICETCLQKVDRRVLSLRDDLILWTTRKPPSGVSLADEKGGAR